MSELLPSTITVPASGIVEAEVFRILGLTWREVYPLHNDVLLSPRDYRYPSRPRYSAYFYTPAGVRTLISHFHLPFEVQDSTPTPPAAPAPRRSREFWWEKENQ